MAGRSVGTISGKGAKGFSVSVRRKVKVRALGTCCICEKPGVDVHHIIPRSEGGSDEDENAVLLCATCHDTYDGNKIKRLWIRDRRDAWYEKVEHPRKVLKTLEEILRVLHGLAGRLDDIPVLRESDTRYSEASSNFQVFSCLNSLGRPSLPAHIVKAVHDAASRVHWGVECLFESTLRTSMIPARDLGAE